MTLSEPLRTALLALLGSVLLGSGLARADDGAAAASPAAPVAPLARAPAAPHASWHLDFALGGGSAIAFTSPVETGHIFWGSIHLAIDDFGVGLVGFGVYPGSRVQTRAGGLLVDGRWYLVGRREVLTPFVALGLGFSAGDALGARQPPEDAIRWAAGGSTFILAPALGLRWGRADGVFIAMEARVVNVSHATFSLGGGIGF